MPTMIVETGALVEGANSYCSVDDADAFHDLIGSADWAGTEAEKEAALIKATISIDALYGAKYDSQIYSQTQELLWPRLAFVDRQGRLRQNGEVPKELKQAVATLAMKFVTGAASMFPEVDNASNVKAEEVSVDGVVSTKTEYFGKSEAAKHAGFTDVEALLAPVLVAKRKSMQLVR